MRCAMPSCAASCCCCKCRAAPRHWPLPSWPTRSSPRCWCPTPDGQTGAAPACGPGRRPEISAVKPVLNISCYQFVPLPDAAALRELLHERAMAAALKGTILLAHEGINMFLAGPAAAVRGFVNALRADPRFADLEPKESWSDTVPFRKMLVKVKREIIRMDHPA